MNKKQAFIIATLLVLIVCAGILATKVNNPLYVDGDSSALTLNDEAKSHTTDFFAESRINREQQNAKTLETLQTIMNEPNASKETKEQASTKYKDLALTSQYETKIESQLKAKGFTDSYCSIDSDRVNIVIKAKDQLTAQQSKAIKDVVLSITKIKDIAIERKE